MYSRMPKRHLRNMLNEEELRARLAAETEPRTTLSFYRYANIEDPDRFRNERYAEWSQLGASYTSAFFVCQAK